MGNKTMGEFLSSLRKEKGMTQMEVADRLSVSNKTVSKWERDEGCPEITILPLIAELFEVSVDEIIKGEKATKEKSEEKTQSPKRSKLYVKRVMLRFKNRSLISFGISIGSLASASVLGFVSYVISQLLAVILMMMSFSALILEAVAFSGLQSSLKEGDFEDEMNLKEAKGKGVSYLSLSVFLSLCATLLNGCYLWLDADILLLLIFPVAVLSMALAFCVYLVLKKEYKLADAEKTEYGKAFYTFKRKLIKRTAVAVSLIIFLSVLIPFANAGFTKLKGDSFVFSSDNPFVDMYENDNEAREDYYTVKSFFENETKMYILDYADKNTLYLSEINLPVEEIEKDGDRSYKIIGICYTDDVEKTFETEGQAEEFVKKYVVNADITNNFLNSNKNNIRFDDASFTVTFASSESLLSMAFDVLLLYVLIGSVLSLLTVLIAFIRYNKMKKEELKGFTKDKSSI